jgi:ParB/RepB/Spo0J family partition protein
MYLGEKMSKELSCNNASDVSSLDELLSLGIQPSGQSTSMEHNQTVQGEIVDDIRLVDPETVHLSANASRRFYNKSEMDDMVESVRREGIIMPVIVRPQIKPFLKEQSGEWECIKGTRRVLAAQETKVKIPIIIRDMDDINARRINLVTTLHRADISAYEKAQALVALQQDMQKELDSWVKESIAAGLVQSTKAKNGVQKKPVQIVTAKAWEQVQKEFVEMPAWVRDAFQRSVDRRSPSITLEDVAGQVGLNKDTVQKYFSVTKLASSIETEKLLKASLPELRMAATIKNPTLQRNFVNAVSRGQSGKQTQKRCREIKQKDQALAAKARFGDSQEYLDAVECISIAPCISEVTNSLKKLSKRVSLKRSKDNPALDEALRPEIERWKQIIRSFETRHVNDMESLHK